MSPSSPLLTKLTTILTLITLLISLHTQATPFLTDFEDDDQPYVLDTPTQSFRSRSLFLGDVIRKGRRCNPKGYNICDGVSANNGTSLLYCCKFHCRNVIRDENNCGVCGHKCRFAESCCGGRCVNAASNVSNCGKCNRKCSSGQQCEYGSCGYA